MCGDLAMQHTLKLRRKASFTLAATESENWSTRATIIANARLLFVTSYHTTEDLAAHQWRLSAAEDAGAIIQDRDIGAVSLRPVPSRSCG
jgi:hypothetical protein